MGKGRTFCGDGQRLAATFAPLAARRACGCGGRVGEMACPPLCIRWENAGRCDGRCSVLRWLMERAAPAGAACSVSGCGKLLSPIGRACSPVLMCLQPSLDVLAVLPWRACSPVLMCLQPSLGVLAAQSRRACGLALIRRRVACVACGEHALEGLRARVIIFPETLLRSSFFPAKVKKTWPIVLCYARLALPLQK